MEDILKSKEIIQFKDEENRKKKGRYVTWIISF